MRHFKIKHRSVAALVFTLGTMLCLAQDAVHEKTASYRTIRVPGALGTYPMAKI